MKLLEVDWHPSSRMLRQFAGFALIFALLFGLILHYKWGLSWRVAYWTWAIGAGVCLLGQCAPKAVLPVYILLMAIALPIGAVISNLLMIAIYFVILTPIGLLLRLFRYDPMHRTFLPDQSSYWVVHQPFKDVQRYFHQY